VIEGARLGAAAPLRTVGTAYLRGGGSILGPFKYHWWELHLACGHTVERRIRWARIPNPPRGWAAQHRGVSLDRLPEPPQRARCAQCGHQAPDSATERAQSAP
jgi:hypothetical protein